MRPSLNCVLTASDGPGYRPYAHPFVVQFYAHVEFLFRASDPVVCCASATVEDASAILAYELAYLSATGFMGTVGYDVPFAVIPNLLQLRFGHDTSVNDRFGPLSPILPTSMKVRSYSI